MPQSQHRDVIIVIPWRVLFLLVAVPAAIALAAWFLRRRARRTRPRTDDHAL